MRLPTIKYNTSLGTPSTVSPSAPVEVANARSRAAFSIAGAFETMFKSSVAIERHNQNVELAKRQERLRQERIEAMSRRQRQARMEKLQADYLAANEKKAKEIAKEEEKERKQLVAHQVTMATNEATRQMEMWKAGLDAVTNNDGEIPFADVPTNVVETLGLKEEQFPGGLVPRHRVYPFMYSSKAAEVLDTTSAYISDWDKRYEYIMKNDTENTLALSKIRVQAIADDKAYRKKKETAMIEDYRAKKDFSSALNTLDQSTSFATEERKKLRKEIMIEQEKWRYSKIRNSGNSLELDKWAKYLQPGLKMYGTEGPIYSNLDAKAQEAEYKLFKTAVEKSDANDKARVRNSYKAMYSNGTQQLDALLNGQPLSDFDLTMRDIHAIPEQYKRPATDEKLAIGFQNQKSIMEMFYKPLDEARATVNYHRQSQTTPQDKVLADLLETALNNRIAFIDKNSADYSRSHFYPANPVTAIPWDNPEAAIQTMRNNEQNYDDFGLVLGQYLPDSFVEEDLEYLNPIFNSTEPDHAKIAQLLGMMSRGMSTRRFKAAMNQLAPTGMANYAVLSGRLYADGNPDAARMILEGAAAIKLDPSIVGTGNQFKNAFNNEFGSAYQHSTLARENAARGVMAIYAKLQSSQYDRRDAAEDAYFIDDTRMKQAMDIWLNDRVIAEYAGNKTFTPQGVTEDQFINTVDAIDVPMVQAVAPRGFYSPKGDLVTAHDFVRDKNAGLIMPVYEPTSGEYFWKDGDGNLVLLKDGTRFQTALDFDRPVPKATPRKGAWSAFVIPDEDYEPF